MLQSLAVFAQVTRASVRQLSVSCPCSAGHKWRDSQGLGRSGNEYGPLTDLPDWSFADGRPAPPQPNQLRRKEEQRQLAERVDVLAKEMLEAKFKHKRKLEEEKAAEERKAERQLKTKGSSWKQEGYINKRQQAPSRN